MTDSIQTLDRHSSDLDRTPRLAASTGRSKGPVTVLFKAVVAWFVTSPAPRAYQPADGYPETSQARAARIGPGNGRRALGAAAPGGHSMHHC
jgi:hypothetical protein